MRIRFDPAFDTGYWPGPLGTGESTREAVAGEAWVGPTGLLGLLETELGLGGNYPSVLKRAAALIPHLRATDGYWSQSLTVDALGTARKLITDRDALISWGWTGAEPVSDRLSYLYRGTESVEPGIPDRFEAVIRRLEVLSASRASLSLESVTLTDRRGSIPPQVGRLLVHLEALGVKIDERIPATDRTGATATSPESASASASAPISANANNLPATGYQGATTDLTAARRENFLPAGDGTLQLVRPYGPVQAAEDLAAWLAARPSLEDVVIIGPDAILDRALARFGLPTTGQTQGTAEVAAALPLALELSWFPQDPQQAYELLLLPYGPIRKSVSWHMVRALQNWPSTESPDWKSGLASALESIEDVKDRERVTARIRTLFERKSERGSDQCTVEDLKERIASVESWARGRSAAIENSGELLATLTAVCAHCQTLSNLLAAAKIDTLSAADLRRWIVAAQPADTTGLPAHAGISWVRDPSQIVEPAGTIIWWSFTRSSAPPIQLLDLTQTERMALLDAGATPPDASGLALLRAERWNRPLRLATESLLLIAPRHADNGDEAFPHPLWDEICGRMPEGQSVDPLVQRVPRAKHEPPVQTGSLHPLPFPTRNWNIPEGVTLEREGESPSSLEKRLGCGFRWTIDYLTRVRPGLSSTPIEPGPLLAGSVAHELLHQLAEQGGLEAENGPGQMAELFDANIAQLAAPYVLPGADGERTDLRHQLVETVRVLSAAMRSSGAKVAGSEQEVSGELFGQKIFGRLDLLLQSPDLLIDYKYGGQSDRRSELQNGTAMQLVLYANLLDRSGEAVHLAYIILRNQVILTTLTGISEAASVAGMPNEISLGAIEKALNMQRAEFGAGRLIAAGVEGDSGAHGAGGDADGGGYDAPVIRERIIAASGAIEIPPGCRYCESSTLCGLAWEANHG